MAGRHHRDVGLTARVYFALSERLGIDKALVGEASRVLDRGAPGTVGRAASDSEAMLVDMTKETAGGLVPKGYTRDAVGIGIDTALRYAHPARVDRPVDDGGDSAG